jgi:seryl-tRNA synthetase
MLKRIKDSFDTGLEKIKWTSSLVSERVKIELSVMKLLYETDQLERRKEELMKTIGRRVIELKEYPDRQLLKDSIVADALTEIDKITAEIDLTRKKASDISKIEE